MDLSGVGPFSWSTSETTKYVVSTKSEMRRTERYVWVRFQVEGIHRYPAAAEDPKLADVAFLAHPHRHIFHFEVHVSVEGNDREIEFILLKRYCQSLYGDGTLQANNKSCEMLAEDLIAKLQQKYPGRNYTVFVSEDGENGAEVSSYLA